MRDGTGFGGGADKWAAVMHCHLSVQRAKGGEYLQPKVPVFFFSFFVHGTSLLCFTLLLFIYFH